MRTIFNYDFSPVTKPVRVKPGNILVLSRGKTFLIEAQDITHLKAEGNYTFVYTRQGKEYVVSKTIKTVHGKLSDRFLRVHKSYIINPDNVISWLEPSILLLNCGKEIPVARRRIRETEELLASAYLRAG